MGNYLSKPNKHKKTQTGENSKVRFGSSEMQGWRVSMEDAKISNLTLDDSTMLFGVFDGHGGHEVSELVSRHFAFELLNSSAYNTGEISEALRWTFCRMDEIIKSPSGAQEAVRISKNLPSNYPVKAKHFRNTVGCAGIVCLLRQDEIYVANAGDSRCVLNRGGSAIDLSIDHKPRLLKEKERILRAGGVIVEGRINGGLNLTRSIGDFYYKNNSGLPANEQMVISEPEVHSIMVTPEDLFIVIACDGIWEVMDSQQCVEFIQSRLSHKGLGIIAEEVLEHCVAPKITNGLGCDNMTIIIVCFKHEAHERT